MASAVVAVAPQVGRAQPVGQRPVDGRFYRRRLRPPCRVRGAASAPPRGTSPAGWPMPVPAMSGAEPCTGSNTPGAVVAERGARAASRSSRSSIAASSLRMSPNMFSVRITSKCARRRDELHRGVVDEQVLELDVRKFARVHVAHDLAPQPAGLEHVGLVDARDARVRGAERDAGDPLDLLARVDADIARPRSAVRVFSPK